MKTIKTLVIDDEVAEMVKENIEDFKFRDARFSVEAVDNCKDAIDKIDEMKENKIFYNVVIVDMKMDDSEEKGLEILQLPLSSVKIVLTAYASVENCVKCLKAGAYDYINKNSVNYDPFERLKRSMEEGLEERLKEPEDPFEKWKSKKLAQLKKEYGGKHIAVIDEIVVDSDKDAAELNKRVKENYPLFNAKIVEIKNKK